MSLSEMIAFPSYCPIEAGIVGNLADNECAHGRLPTDTTPPCGCWPQEAPQPAPAICQAEADYLATPVVRKEQEMDREMDPEAPHGRKRDGTPRAKPGRKTARARQARPAVSAPEADRLAGVREGIRKEIAALDEQAGEIATTRAQLENALALLG